MIDHDKSIPQEVLTALEHVRSYHPSVSLVVFNTDVRWLYLDNDLEPLVFNDEVDCNILNDAADSLIDLPAVFSIKPFAQQ